MKRSVLILQARMGSQRLPGKSLMDLAGAPMTARIIERIKRCQNIHEIVLATTRQGIDDTLAKIAEEYQVGLFRGEEHDLVDRYYQAAREFNADIVLRLPADNPVSEPSEIDRCVGAHLSNKAHFTSNITSFFGNGYPDGIGIEVFDIDVLEDIWKREKNPMLREHVALNFVDYYNDCAVQPERYFVETLQCPISFRRPDLKLDVNELHEYLYFKDMYDDLYSVNPDFGILDIIRWHDARFKIDH